MTKCNINLARGIIYPKTRRIILHWTMLAYLCIAGIVLVFTIIGAVDNIKRAAEFHKVTEEIQNRFKKEHPDKTSLTDYAAELNTILLENSAEITAIDNALPDKVQTMLPLLISLVSQPDRSEIYNLVFIQQLKSKKPSLEFSLYLPIAEKSSPVFLSEWQNDTQLIKQFKDITPVTTKRGRVNNHNVSIMSYLAEFRE